MYIPPAESLSTVLSQAACPAHSLITQVINLPYADSLNPPGTFF